VIVLDKARYQHCKLVENLAKEFGITLRFLPSYSPNLNLIERLWKFVKKKCLYNMYYENFEEFKNGIHNRLDKVETDYKEEIKKLITSKFQNFKKEQLLAL
jgi:transposase